MFYCNECKKPITQLQEFSWFPCDLNHITSFPLGANLLSLKISCLWDLAIWPVWLKRKSWIPCIRVHSTALPFSTAQTMSTMGKGNTWLLTFKTALSVGLVKYPKKVYKSSKPNQLGSHAGNRQRYRKKMRI